jgi:hypothetical protein
MSRTLIMRSRVAVVVGVGERRLVEFVIWWDVTKWVCVGKGAYPSPLLGEGRLAKG